MDYQYYRGKPLVKMPEKLIPWLPPIGFGMSLGAIILPLLMIVHLIESTFLMNCISFVFGFYGAVLFVYGYSLKKVRKSANDADARAVIDAFYEKKRKENSSDPVNFGS